MKSVDLLHIDPEQAKLFYRRYNGLGSLAVRPIHKHQAGFRAAVRTLDTLPEFDALGNALPEPTIDELTAHLDQGLAEIRRQGVLPLSPTFMGGFNAVKDGFIDDMTSQAEESRD